MPINPMLSRWRSVWAGLHAKGVLPRKVVAAAQQILCRGDEQVCGQCGCEVRDDAGATQRAASQVPSPLIGRCQVQFVCHRPNSAGISRQAIPHRYR